MLRSVKSLLLTQLPINYGTVCESGQKQRFLVSNAMQRTGQHLIINWICLGLEDSLHVNLCHFYRKGLTVSPIPSSNRWTQYKPNGEILDTGERLVLPRQLPDYPRTHNVLFSFENYNPEGAQMKKLLGHHDSESIIIIRDPLNWLASILKRFPQDVDKNIKTYNNHLKLAAENRENAKHRIINYNDFIHSSDYRQKLSQQLGKHNLTKADAALDKVPDFGGGSSFGGLGKQQKQSYTTRWKEFENNERYRQLCRTIDLQTAKTLFDDMVDIENFCK